MTKSVNQWKDHLLTIGFGVMGERQRRRNIPVWASGSRDGNGNVRGLKTRFNQPLRYWC